MAAPDVIINRNSTFILKENRHFPRFRIQVMFSVISTFTSFRECSLLYSPAYKIGDVYLSTEELEL